MTVGGWVFAKGHGLACSDTNLFRDDVHASDSFGHRVLNLHAGVDFQEGNGAVFGHDKLDGAGAGVVDLGANSASTFDDAVALLFSQVWCGRFLE